MAMRSIIEIDEETCNGCGECAGGCPEGAIRIIDGKARLVGESLCDGLGACIGTCPVGAITILEREAEAYDERKVMEGIAKQGPAVIAAHLEHLDHHGQDEYYRQGVAYLRERGLPVPLKPQAEPCACPGSRERTFVKAARPVASDSGSALTHWPIQLHLINPRAPHYRDADLLIAADCTAFSLGGFHGSLLDGKALVIACPKLDQGREIYVEKLATLLKGAKSVTVAIMEVPCCSGLLKMTLDARLMAGTDASIEVVKVGVQGEILSRTAA